MVDINTEKIGVTAICGPEGCGKTTMALSWPRPIYHMDIDVGGYERAAWMLDSTDGIVTQSFARPIQESKMLGNVPKRGQSGQITDVRIAKQVEGMRELWTDIVKAFIKSLKDPKINTIVLDSATMLWQIAHSAHLQELQEKQIAENKVKPDMSNLREKLMSMEYGPANDRMRQLFHSARGMKKNLVLVHYPRDVYKDVVSDKGEVTSMRTGALEMDGFKETQKHSDLVVWLHVNEEKVPSTVPGAKTTIKHHPIAKIVDKCGIQGMGMNALGLEFPANFQAFINLRNILRQVHAAQKGG